MKSEAVIVVGAGIAGLNCAYQLRKCGVHALVCEATGRTGGRIWSDQDGNGTPFERGGEFVNEEHADLRALCQELGVRLHSLYSEGQTAPRIGYMDGGTLRTDEELARAVQPLVRQLRADGLLLLGEKGEWHRERFEKMTAAEYLEPISLPEWAMRQVQIFLVAEMGRELSDLPAADLFSLESLVPEQPWVVHAGYGRYIVDGGTEQVTRALAARLDGQVETDRALLALHDSGGHYSLFLEGLREELVADWVVLAVPYTALRRVDLDQVLLSPRKRRAIRELQYATNAKVIVPYQGRVSDARTGLSELVSDSLRAFVWESSRYRQGDFSSLTIYRGGQEGARTSTATVAAEREALIARLQAAYPGSARRQSGDLVAVSWPDGSYSCIAPGQQFDFGDALGTPEGRVLFCGEHTSTVARGFMSGAAASGVEAACHILTAMGRSTQALTRPLEETGEKLC